MKIRRQLSTAVLASAILVLMAALWIILAPVQFGGQSSYVMVAGASMEPALHRGDLVVVRQEQTYEVGDIVTYHHPTIGPIIHRIIARQGDRYLFKGDNNEWVDSYEPKADEIVGKEWIYLPGAANWLLKLRTPTGLALLSLTIAMMLMTTFIKKSSEPASGRKEETVFNRERFAAWANNLDGLFFALGAVAFAALLLGLFAFTRPLTVGVPADIPFEHHGQFEYHAGAPPSVYDGGQLVTGDPVFHQLVSTFDLDFKYRLVSQFASNLHGTASMQLRVSDSSGWRRTIELLPETEFSGPEAVLSTAVDLTPVLKLTQMLRERTSTERQGYSVDILPVIQISGLLEGLPFDDRFAPALTFQLDELELYLRNTSDPLHGNGDPLKPTTGGFLPRTQTQPATLSILGLDPTVETARWIAGVGFGLGLAGMLGLWLVMRQISQRDRAAEIQLEYGPLLVEVEALELKRGMKQTDVRRIDDLAKLAERGGVMILHLEKDDEHVYCVQLGETCYRYILLTPLEPDVDLNRARTDGES
ncbi:MAG: signal peptidase I [Anaerolineales bacterium]